MFVNVNINYFISIFSQYKLCARVCKLHVCVYVCECLYLRLSNILGVLRNFHFRFR